MQFTIVTGLSGAGRTSALKTLEDMGYFCIDNILPPLIPEFAKLAVTLPKIPELIAVTTDMRMGDMFDSIYDAIDKLKDMEINLDIIFLDASDDVLISRFQQTRRRHPVSGSGKVISGILYEREKMQRIKEMASLVLDTSSYSPKDLALVLESYCFADNPRQFSISVITFGYKYGIPMDGDLVFDMRFLPNPFYLDALRDSSGLSDSVRSYVLSFPAAEQFLQLVTDLVRLVVPCYIEQEKRQLVICIGCTGGMHRSVAIGEELFRRLSNQGVPVSIEHRDLSNEQSRVRQPAVE